MTRDVYKRQVYESDSTKASGVVLKQSVEVGTKLKKGDTITITVNEITTTETPTTPTEPTTPETPTTPNTNEVPEEGTNNIVNTNTVL